MVDYENCCSAGKAQRNFGLDRESGHRVPDITILFIGAFLIVCVISALMSPINFSYINPVTKEPIRIISMLAPSQLVKLMTKMVTNYSGFPPLGMVIVATLGIAIADGSGYIRAGLRKLLAVTPKAALSPIIILAGMLSHIGPDTGFTR